MAIKSADQITIIDVTDAYSVSLTSEAYNFVGTSDGAPSGSSCTTQAQAACGSNQITNVIVTASEITCPSGVSATVSGSGTVAPTITVTLTAALTETKEVVIPVHVDDLTFNKKFTIAVSKAGVNGSSVTITSKSVKYQVGNSGTTAPTGTWSETIPTVGDGKYLWTQTIVNYSDGKSTEAYSVSYKAANGSNGTSITISSQVIEYLVGDSGTTAPTGTWSESIPAVAEGKYLWTRTTVTYSDSTSVISYSVSRNAVDGNDGADAITITITSSAGTVFKNSTGITVLTANVFVGGVKQTIKTGGVVEGLGTIKWYKAGNSSAIATAETLTVNASDVVNAAVYTCQLEA